MTRLRVLPGHNREYRFRLWHQFYKRRNSLEILYHTQLHSKSQPMAGMGFVERHYRYGSGQPEGKCCRQRRVSNGGLAWWGIRTG